MSEFTKIGVLGGDLRQAALARALADYGCEVAAWGLCSSPENNTGIVRCVDYTCAVRGSAAVILPLPATTDGVRLNYVCAEKDDQKLRLTELFDSIPSGTLVLAGKAGETMKRLAAERKIEFIDYFDNEELQIKNAVPTAEGAIAIAMNELPITIMGASCAILGYGRIAKVLARDLKSLGAKVTVSARSGKDLAWAEVDGCMTKKLSVFLQENSRYDVIFNTIPACILDKGALEKIDPHTLIIDLAASPGGIDVEAVKKTGHKTIWALSLPGKTSPETAGKILCSTVLNLLEARGIVT